MFGIDVNGPAKNLNDNEISLNNSSKIKSTLNKKNSSIAYHLVLQNVSAGVVNIVWIPTADNIEYALTNRLK